MRRVHSIVIHHTAGPDTATAAQINQRHISNGWLGIGYHFVITRAGGAWHIETGRDIEKRGAHAGRGFPGNLGSVGVAVAGNYVKTEPPRAALALLVGLIRQLEGKYGHLFVYGHCDLNMTACPGQMLYNWIPAIRDYDGGEIDTAIPPNRALAVDRTDARYQFRLLSQWAKGVGGRP